MSEKIEYLKKRLEWYKKQVESISAEIRLHMDGDGELDDVWYNSKRATLWAYKDFVQQMESVIGYNGKISQIMHHVLNKVGLKTSIVFTPKGIEEVNQRIKDAALQDWYLMSVQSVDSKTYIIIRSSHNNEIQFYNDDIADFIDWTK